MERTVGADHYHPSLTLCCHSLPRIVSLKGKPSVFSACYSPDRTVYTASTLQGHISLWNIAHNLLWELDTPIHPIHCLRLSADQHAISSPDGSVWSWKMHRGKSTNATPATSETQLNIMNAYQFRLQTTSLTDNAIVPWNPFKVDAGYWAYTDSTIICFESIGGGSVAFIDVWDFVY